MTMPSPPEPSFSKDLSLQARYLISLQKYKFTLFCYRMKKKNNDLFCFCGSHQLSIKLK